MTVTLYGIPHCDTVKRARAWLHEHGVEHRFHDYKKAGVPPRQLDAWIAALGWDRLVNRSGTTWRKLDESQRENVRDADSARALMQAQPSVIRRPIVEWADGATTLGFAADEWRARLARP